MENPHSAVADLVTKLHANIDSIHACINSLSDTSSHDAELERLEVEREEKIKELRKAHEDAVKALADQRQEEKEELEAKRKKEAEELEEQRRREYEELMARRKKEDEERAAKLEAEEAERERIKKEEDDKREQEKEDTERTLQEKVEKELEALEDEMERKVEEGKKALRDLDEKRKAINAQIDAALNTPTVIPTIHFRSRAKTLSRAKEPVSENFPTKDVGETPANGTSDASQSRRVAAEKPAESKELPIKEEKQDEVPRDNTEAKDKKMQPVEAAGNAPVEEPSKSGENVPPPGSEQQTSKEPETNAVEESKDPEAHAAALPDQQENPTITEGVEEMAQPKSTNSPIPNTTEHEDKDQPAQSEATKNEEPERTEEPPTGKEIEADTPFLDKRSDQVQDQEHDESPKDIASTQEQVSKDGPVSDREPSREEGNHDAPTDQYAEPDEMKDHVPSEQLFEQPEHSELQDSNGKPAEDQDAGEEQPSSLTQDKTVEPPSLPNSEQAKDTEGSTHPETTQAVHEPSPAETPESHGEPSGHSETPAATIHETPESEGDMTPEETVAQPESSRDGNSGADVAPTVPGTGLQDVQSDRGEDKDVRDPVGQFPGPDEHEASMSEGKPSEDLSSQPVEENSQVSDKQHLEKAGDEMTAESPEEPTFLPEEHAAEKEESPSALPSDSHGEEEHPCRSESVDPSHRQVEHTSEDIPVQASDEPKHIEDHQDNDGQNEGSSKPRDQTDEKDGTPTSQIEPANESTEPGHQKDLVEDDNAPEMPEVAASQQHDDEPPKPTESHDDHTAEVHESSNTLSPPSGEHESHPSGMATPEPPREGLGEATSTLAVVPETPTSSHFAPESQSVESAHDEEPSGSGDHVETSDAERGNESHGADLAKEAESDEHTDHGELNAKAEGQSSNLALGNPPESLGQEKDDGLARNASESGSAQNDPAHDDHQAGEHVSKNSPVQEHEESHIEEPHGTTMEPESKHEESPPDSQETTYQPASHVVEPETQTRGLSADGTPMETPMSSDEFFTPMVEGTRDDEASQYPFQSRSQEPTPTFPKPMTHGEDSEAALPQSVGVMQHPEPETKDDPLSVDPVSHTIVPQHIIEALDDAGVDTAPSTEAQDNSTELHDNEPRQESEDQKDNPHIHEPVDTSGTFADHQDVSQPMTATSSRADTWVSAEEEQGAELGHDQQGERPDAPSNNNGLSIYAQDQDPDHEKPIPSPLGLGAATMHHSREVDRESTPPNTQVPVDTTHEDEHQRALNNVATEPGFTPLERPEPRLDEYTRPRTPIQAPHFSERHAESPVTVLNADNLFDDDSDDDDDSFPLGQYQDTSPAKSSEPEEPINTDDIAEQYLDESNLDPVPEHEPIHRFSESPHRNPGLFANVVDTIRSDLPLVRQMSDEEAQHPQASRPQSVSFDESAGPFDYAQRDNSLHVRTHTADTVPSFESYAHSDTPTSPSEAASSPFQETPHEEPRIQSSWHDDVPADDQHQELKPQASPLQADFDPFNSTANPNYISPQLSQSNLHAEYNPSGYSGGVDAPRSPIGVQNSPSPSPRLPTLNTDASQFSEGRPYDSPVSATHSVREDSSSPPPSSLARRPTTGPKIPSSRTPVSSPSIPSNSFFQKTRSLFESGVAQQAPNPPAARPLSGFFSVGKSTPPPPPRTSRPSSLDRAEYNEEEDGEPIVPRSLDGDGRPPSPVFIPSSSPARSSNNSRSGSISSLRKSISRDEEDFNSVTKRASNPFLGGLSRLVEGETFGKGCRGGAAAALTEFGPAPPNGRTLRRSVKGRKVRRVRKPGFESSLERIEEGNEEEEMVVERAEKVEKVVTKVSNVIRVGFDRSAWKLDDVPVGPTKVTNIVRVGFDETAWKLEPNDWKATAKGDARDAWLWVEGWRARLRAGGDLVEKCKYGYEG